MSDNVKRLIALLLLGGLFLGWTATMLVAQFYYGKAWDQSSLLMGYAIALLNNALDVEMGKR